MWALVGVAYAIRYLLPASPRHDCGWGAACHFIVTITTVSATLLPYV